MDSDESRPGSSASNSSSSSNSNYDGSPSSRKSRSKTRSKSPASRSSSASSLNDSVPKSPINGAGLLSRSRSPTKSLRSMSPDGDAHLLRSISKESVHSPVSSDNENPMKRQNQRSVSRNQSISPVRRASSQSSRNSSASSVSDDDDDEERLKTDEISDVEMESDKDGSASVKKTDSANSGDTNHKPETVNMSHEDLSDVSDLESPASAHEPDNDDKDEEDEEEDRPVSV